MPRLRLVKVLVQPIYMLDDGETLTELPSQAVPIPASAWPKWAVEDFPKQQAEMAEQLGAANEHQ